jgi:1-acyl-sn-glycerol-3-phosphate acyltransferase
VNEWSYEPSPDLQKSVAERLRGFPRAPDMSVYALRSAAHVVLRAFLRAYFGLRVVGREHLPRDTSFVLVCNHTSHLDTLCLLSALPLRSLHRAFPAAAADYFFSSLPRSVFSAIFVNGMPFDRKSGGAESLEICRALLERPRHALILFPEGTRSASGELGRFRSGIGRLVAGTEVPVLPCHLSGADRAFPKGAHFPRPERLVLRIGAPRRFADRIPAERDQVEAIGTELRDRVLELARGGPADALP